MNGHVREMHKGECPGQYSFGCNLYICAVCGGSEGSLLPYCPGRRLTPEEDAANYAHYCAGTGPFARPSLENVTAARVFAERYVADDDSLGPRRFYDAVRELGEFVVSKEGR